ncbi:MAG: hypothetical protein WBG02_06505 [Candidatus Acidiferrum sp.]
MSTTVHASALRVCGTSTAANPMQSWSVLTEERPAPMGWRAAGFKPSNYNAEIRLELETLRYFHSLSGTDLQAENQLGDALSHSAGYIDFNAE